ncbi:amino acid adenylation domain-containing protein [Microbulbifer sp. SSSA007]|uniref:amino acid adenylation domain-containing protein n=1 Tax=Microbulbifer sp. SSSA007 TaxID=3243379 RepID=UPI004039CA0A
MLALLKELKKNKLAVWVSGDILKLASSGDEIPQELLTRLKAEKSQLVKYLQKREIDSQKKFSKLEELIQYRLSFAQERLLFIERLQPETCAYHIPYLVQLNQDARLDILQSAFTHLAIRHPVLNSVYIESDNRNISQILSDPVKISTNQLSTEEKLLPAVKDEIVRPFDLSQDPPMRLKYYEVNKKLYLLIMWHHIAFDGWSMDIFLRELSSIYQSLLNSQEVRLPDLSIQYSDYAQWQRDYLNGENLSKLKSFWHNTLCGYELLVLPTDRPRPKKMDYRGKNTYFTLETGLSLKLRHYAQTRETTLYTVLLSAFFATLSSLSGQEDILIGTPSDNRHHAQTQDVIGFFVNSLALRLKLNADITADELIRQVHQVVSAAKTHQDLPFESLIDTLEVERDLSRHPLFQVMFTVQNFGLTNLYELPFTQVETDPQNPLYSPAKADLRLTLDDSGNQIKGIFSYAVSLFDEDSIIHIGRVYQKILVQMLEQPSRSINTFDSLSDRDRQKVLIDWNQTSSPGGNELSLSHLFETQALINHDSIAVSFEEKQLTYQELNEKANQLARAIQHNYQNKHGDTIRPDTIVALYFEQSLEMVIGILAVLKAGAAYLPLACDAPQKRLKFQLEDSNSALVLSQSFKLDKLRSLLEEIPTPPLLLAVDNQVETAPYSIENLSHGPQGNNLAYLIYTSGTSGTPKGVMVEHKSVVNLIKAQSEAFNFDNQERVLWLLSYVFDASVEPFYLALLNGGRLILPERGILKQPEKIIGLLAKHQVTHLVASPAHLLTLGDIKNKQQIKRVVFGGESCSPELVNIWKDKLINEYGPTEATVTAIQSLNFYQQNNNRCIGRPINNVKAYVLNKKGYPVPIGAPGELYIGGAGVARGYLNQEALTAQSFIDNPFANNEDKSRGYDRLYKTGDLVRWLPSGNLEYLERIGQQVKIRGYRIELGEIETALTNIEAVKQALVTTYHHQGSTLLIAYIVPLLAQDISSEALRKTLALSLPEYMLPESYACLDQIPLTTNGKVDYCALPTPELISKDNYLAPRTELESQMCQIWQRVLGLKQVGVKDDFFRIGGHSINAVKLIATIRQELAIEVSLEDLFEQKNIATLISGLKRQELLTIPRSNATTFPLSFAQERLLFIEQFESGSSAYHIPYFTRLKPKTSLDKLEQALNAVIRRHTVLNSIYYTDNKGISRQEMLSTPVTLQMHKAADKKQLTLLIRKECMRSFDLEKEGAIRLHIYQLGEVDYLLILWHHIAFDGWSSGIFIKELSEIYQAICQKREAHLPELDIQYRDYAAWQHDYLQGEQQKKQLQYWQQRLSGYEPLALPLDYPRPTVADHRGKYYRFTLGSQISAQLRTLARDQGTSLYTVLLSGFYLCLTTLSGQEDILVGTPSDNRHHVQTQNLIGFFVNPLALRVVIKPEMSIKELLATVHQIVTSAKVHQEFPFERLVEELKIERDSSRHPLFQVMFGLQNNGQEISDSEKLPFIPEKLVDESNLYVPAKFDLSLSLNDCGDEITAGFNYAVSLFDKESIVRISSLYQRMLSGLLSRPDLPIAQIEKLSAADRQKTLYQWNDTQVNYPDRDTIHGLFEQQVRQTPDRIALVFEQYRFSYRELNQKSNRLARALLDKYRASAAGTIQPNTLVGLCFQRSADMVVAILAVLKAGAAYVPIAPDLPQARIKFMLEDAQVSLVMSDKQSLSALPASDAGEYQAPSTLVVDDDKGIAEYHYDNLPETSSSNHLAYVIYTSGTTGKPKGVLVPHNAVAAFACNNRYLEASRVTNIASLSSYAFDGFIFDLFYSVLNGCSMHLATQDVIQSPIHLINYLNSHHIDSFFITTALLSVLAKENLLNGLKVKNILFGGEKANAGTFHQLVNDHPKISFTHVYGPTETVVFATACHLNTKMRKLPIGSPLYNKKLYVLDKSGQLSPVGTSGELYIGGAGIAHGYLNQKELTAKSFINNPYASDEDRERGHDRLYKTGDLVRWLPDGNLEYLGRIGKQVKIRGYRIELGEIESALHEIDVVKQALVTTFHHEENAILVAYIVPGSREKTSPETIKQTLSINLPGYMVPESYIFLEKLPLTPNGKLDYRALPNPQLIIDDNYLPPRTNLEQNLCLIWQQILGLDRVGIADDFFRIGGHSINAVQLIATIRRELGIELPLATLFEKKNIAALSKGLEEKPLLRIPSVKVGPYPLSFSQERLFFIEKFDSGASTYHIPYLVRLKPQASLNNIERAICEVVRRHTVLNSIYYTDKHGVSLQEVQPREIKINKHQLNDEAQLKAALLRENNHPFDLNHEGAVRLHMYQLGKQRYLLILWHHIAFDGWSTGIFIKEFSQIYHAICEGQQASLPSLEIQYHDYAVWQRAHLKGETLENLLNYWQKTLSGYEPLALPLDHPRPPKADQRGKHYHFILDRNMSAQLRAFARAEGTTLYTLLLTGFYLCLATLSGQEDILVGTPSDNRHHAQTQDLIGFFVNTLVLRTILDTKMTVKDLIAQVHQTVTQAKVHQELPFERLLEALDVERDTSRHPLFQVMFGVQSFVQKENANENFPFLPSELDGETSLYSPAIFDLSLFLNDGSEEITATFNYAISLFDENTIIRIANLYQHLLTSLLATPKLCIDQIDRVSETERQLILGQWNNTRIDFPEGQTLHGLFEQQALQTPNNISLIFEQQRITYRQLNERANRLARILSKQYQSAYGQSIIPDTLISLYFERGIDMVIAILAVLKAGGAYLPLSPDYPEQRLRYIISDSQCPMILTGESIEDKLRKIIGLERQEFIFCVTQELLLNEAISGENLPALTSPSDLAYVIYTSGTTGMPKGVMIEHRSCVNLMQHNIKAYEISSDESLLLLANYTFDASIEQIFIALLSSSRLVITSEADIQSFSHLEQLIEQESITHLDAPSSLLLALELGEKHGLKRVISGGEVTSTKLAGDLGDKLINVYGPTEATISSHQYHCPPQSEDNQIPIGRAIANNKSYVLDKSGQLLGIGAVGELHIGGAGLARGYLNQPQLTAERFIKNPFASEEDKARGYTRLYKTGDLVRWLPSGELDYIGRNDLQVKIRGFRIELGEVEAALNDLEGVKQAVVTDHEYQNQKYLAAYLVPDSEESKDLDLLKATLTSVLPDYMIPTSFNWIDKVPVNLSGKLDKKSLPNPKLVSQTDYLAPRTQLERQLCEVWQQVLGLDQVGIRDNYFSIGGDSIKAISLGAKSRQIIGIDIPLAMLFANQTIEKLSTSLQQDAASNQDETQEFEMVL